MFFAPGGFRKLSGLRLGQGDGLGQMIELQVDVRTRTGFLPASSPSKMNTDFSCSAATARRGFR
jgi:hypothetical protein